MAMLKTALPQMRIHHAELSSTGVADSSPALVRWLAVLWASASTTVWQRAEQGWTAAQAERGAPQGFG